MRQHSGTGADGRLSHRRLAGPILNSLFVVVVCQAVLPAYDDILPPMELKEAIEKARYILDEEEIKPTLDYRYDSDEWPDEFKWDMNFRQQGYSPRFTGHIALSRMRSRHPREVFENPVQWRFESTNYALITAVYSQLSDADKGLFLGGLLNIYTRKLVAPARNSGAYCAWNGHLSALPLLSEFCVRNGRLGILLAVVSHVDLPNANLVNMLTQLQEMISLNFNAFSESELMEMPKSLTALRTMAERQTWQTRRDRGGANSVRNEHFKQGFSAAGNAVVQGVDAFLEQCRKAHYFYVKGALQQNRNPEIEADKVAVQDYLTNLGFDPTMVQALNVAEQYYRDTATAFDLKNCLGIVRSFYEKLHIDVGQAVAGNKGATVVEEWDPTLTFLKNQRFLSPQQDKFARGIYALLSDEGVHPLITEREFARVLRNVVIEYGLMFLTMMAKAGFTIRGVNVQKRAANES